LIVLSDWLLRKFRPQFSTPIPGCFRNGLLALKTSANKPGKSTGARICPFGLGWSKKLWHAIGLGRPFHYLSEFPKRGRGERWDSGKEGKKKKKAEAERGNGNCDF